MTALWKRYVALSLKEDYAGLMHLRCVLWRRPDSYRREYLDHVRRLLVAVGSPSVESVALGAKTPANLDRLTDAHSYDVVLRYPNGVRGAIKSLVGMQDGALSLCEVATPAAAKLVDNPPRPADAGLVTVSLSTLMPAIPAGAHMTEDARFVPWSGPKPVEARSRYWKIGSNGDGGHVVVARFATTDDAVAVIAEHLRRELPDAQATFSVSVAPGAVGLRLVADNYSMLQTSTVGPYVDEVTMRYGSTIINVAVGPVATGSSHTAVSDLASLVLSRLRGATRSSS